MESSVPLQIAETIQTASINRAPSPSHDLNPSTAASEKQPVAISHSQPGTSSSLSLDKYEYDHDDGIDDDEDEDEEDIPYDVLRPIPRRGSFPPLPDLRFEQSYLSSISKAESNWQVAFITLRDQLVLPLVQGMVWSLALHGWRYWNRTAQMSGSGVGAKVRRWWYRTNNWKIPEHFKDIPKDSKLAANMSDAS
ncbi:hypothetical protein BP5796_08677 [Coleophoma crateriformis]|uniref:DUF1770-domain-containing protein n=1 Tax=Coleophoma crateriformis TaxID=565419 RepID=A0A3D8R8K8_9HELO|nr:hypothetical protein BP5796_08677 [Coleophoma crateriformis]